MMINGAVFKLYSPKAIKHILILAGLLTYSRV